jgi:hypothetical protein
LLAAAGTVFVEESAPVLINVTIAGRTVRNLSAQLYELTLIQYLVHGVRENGI